MKNILFLLAMLTTLPVAAQNTDTRLFEMRTYYAPPGKLDALMARFQKHTTKLFEKHGMQNIGYWLPVENEKNVLIYVLAYPDMDARNAAWKAFSEDPKWKKVQAKSERNGKIVLKVESVFMKATDFSPEIVESKTGNRVFELRTYMPGPGKLNDLLKRFREHTTSLFIRHGMVNVAYWTTVEKDGAQPKLVYILAHPGVEEGKKAFQEFRADPEWVQVKAASETNGVLAERVESVYMKALVFSKIR